MKHEKINMKYMATISLPGVSAVKQQKDMKKIFEGYFWLSNYM